MHASALFRAYLLLRSRTQFEAVMLSDLFGELNLNPENEERNRLAFLTTVSNLQLQGRVVLSTADWSLASPRNRQFELNVAGQRMLQIRFLNPKTQDLTTSQHSALVTSVSTTKNHTRTANMKTKSSKTTEPMATVVVVENEAPLPKGKKQSKEIRATKAEKDQAKVKKATAKAKPEKKQPRIDTGFVAAIRDRLNKGKYTVADMAAEVLEQFPDKNLDSIKRIGHNLAKRARKTDPETKAKWLPGAPTSTGYMARIDELLRAGKLTTRQIGEKVAIEFPKEGVSEEERVVSAKKVIRARLKRLKSKGETFNVPLEAAIREEKPKAEKKEAKAKATPKPKKESAGAKAERLVKEAKSAKGKAKK